MELRQRETKRLTLSEWRQISALVLVLIVWSASLLAATTPTTPPTLNTSHRGSAVVRIPVIDRNDIRFSRLSTAQGLSQTRVAQIVQDDQGFIWFGTEYGLDRYDGYEFKVFTHDPARENSLSCVYIHSLFKDHSGALWIGCDRFLDRFDPIKERFTHYQIDPEAGAVPNFVDQISQDRAGTIWLATGKGLFGLNPESGHVIHFVHDPANQLSLSSNRIGCTLEDKTGRFWVADGNFLEELDRKTGNVLFRVKLDDDTREKVLFEDHSGALWVAYVTSGKGSGLATLDRATNRIISYALYDKRTGKSISGGIRAIVEDQSNTMWLATFGTPLLKFDRQHSLIIRYQNHPDEPDSIAENRAIALFADHEGNIWIGLNATPPNFFRPEGEPFSSLPINRIDPHSYGETLVNAILEDHKGELWMATDGGLNRIDRKSGEASSYHVSLGPGLSNDIIAIAEDHHENIWLGSFGNGVSRFDPRTGFSKSYRHDPVTPSSLSNNIVSRMLIDHSGTMWLATYNGLDRFDPHTQRFVTYKQDNTSDAEEYFNLAEDNRGVLWMGSWGGLNGFDPKSGRFSVYTHRTGDPKSLTDDAVTSVLVDHAGTVWISTENGLNKLNRESGTFTHYFARDGLPSNFVSCILEDHSGKLWMSTNRGLSRFDPISNEFTNYTSADGLPGNDLTGWDACFRSPSGEMFFGGFSGGVAFFPDKVSNASYPLPLALTDFQVNGKSVEVGPKSLLSKSINYTSGITLTHDQYVFSLSFAALTFFNPDANRYRYKLEGLDHDWVEVDSARRMASYTTLPPGNYTFHLQSATRQGTWKEPGLTLAITILPPWWSTWWFKLSCVVAFAGLLWTLYLIRLRQMAAEIRARIEERLSERDRIARELHDTLLQGIQGLILRFHAVAELIPASEVAHQMIEKALDRADEVLIQGRDRVKNLRLAPEAEPLPSALTSAIKDLVRDKGIEFSVVVEGDQRVLNPLVRDEIYWIGHEALVNAIQHAGGKRIELEIAYDSLRLRLRIRDDGRGIEPEIIEAGGKPGHWGMLGMRERAAKIGARLETWSRPGSGTEVELTIPGSVAYITRRNRRSKRKLRQLLEEEVLHEPDQDSDG